MLELMIYIIFNMNFINFIIIFTYLVLSYKIGLYLLIYFFLLCFRKSTLLQSFSHRLLILGSRQEKFREVKFFSGIYEGYDKVHALLC